MARTVEASQAGGIKIKGGATARPGGAGPPRDSKGADLARTEWKPGWKGGGVFARRYSPLGPPPLVRLQNFAGQCPPEPARWAPRILPCRVRAPGALERRVLPSEVPRLSLPGSLSVEVG